MPDRWRTACDDRPCGGRDRLLPEMPRCVAGPGGTGQDHRAIRAARRRVGRWIGWRPGSRLCARTAGVQTQEARRVSGRAVRLLTDQRPNSIRTSAISADSTTETIIALVTGM